MGERPPPPEALSRPEVEALVARTRGELREIPLPAAPDGAPRAVGLALYDRLYTLVITQGPGCDHAALAQAVAEAERLWGERLPLAIVFLLAAARAILALEEASR